MQQAVSDNARMITQFDMLYRSPAARSMSESAEQLLLTAKSQKSLFYNRMLEENPEQKLAISIIALGLNRPFPFLLFGRMHYFKLSSRDWKNSHNG
jgi:hypothetical protein